jgi:hypothetical protein
MKANHPNFAIYFFSTPRPQNYHFPQDKSYLYNSSGLFSEVHNKYASFMLVIIPRFFDERPIGSINSFSEPGVIPITMLPIGNIC